MTPQDYTVKDFKVGNFKDQNNNTWCNVVFEEEPGSQHTWVVKDPSKVYLGQSVYGHITEETSKAGKTYTRFRKDQKPDGGGFNVGNTGSPVGSSGAARQFKADPEKQASIEAQFSIKTAIEYLHNTDPKASLEDVEAVAIVLFNMIDKVKTGGSQGVGQVAEAQRTPATNEVQIPEPAARNNPNKRDWSKVGQGTGHQEQPDEQWDEPNLVDLNSIFPPEE